MVNKVQLGPDEVQVVQELWWRGHPATYLQGQGHHLSKAVRVAQDRAKDQTKEIFERMEKVVFIEC
jgi:hypothetical protein